MALDRSRLIERMRDEHVSQAELARRIGISQQAIGKLVNGGSRATTHLHRIARELGTTPAYLTGETDDPEEDAPTAPEFTHDERQLVDCYVALDAVQRAALLTIAMSMAGRTAPARVHAPQQGYRARLDGSQPSE